MHRHCVSFFVATFCSVVVENQVVGQAASQPSVEVLMSCRISYPAQVTVTRLYDLDVGKREAKLKINPAFRTVVQFLRGEMLMLVQDPDTLEYRTAVRTNITEILENGELLCTFGPEAARAVRNGPVFCLYPYQGVQEAEARLPLLVATKKLRELPEVMPLGSNSKDKDTNLAAFESQASAFVGSSNNLRQILTAMNQFHDVYGHFPPAVIFGPDGKPWHSWRTLLLPYLGRNDLYGKYDFSKPWNAPANKAVVDTIVEVYKDPIYGDSPEPVTHFAGLVGDQAMFDPVGSHISDLSNPLANIRNGSRGLRDVTDGTALTLMVAPVSNDRKIPWAKPEDIVFGPEFPGLGKPGGIATPYVSKDGKSRRAPVAKVDGAVFPLHDDVPIEIVRAMITFNGGEAIEATQVRNPEDNKAPKDGLALFKIIRKVDGSIMAVID